MNRLQVLFFLLLLSASSAFSAAVGVVDGTNEVYFTLVSSTATVQIEDQVSVVTARQTLRNTLGESKEFVYAFPLPVRASATGLRWKVYGKWYEAQIAATSQDSTVPGPGSTAENLLKYLGTNALYFQMPDSLDADSTILFELDYVELLEYQAGKVQLRFPNDYHLIQTSMVATQTLDLSLTSSRTIDSLSIRSSQNVYIRTVGSNNATVQVGVYEQPAAEDFEIDYSLSLDELGLFGFSTLLPDSLTPDGMGGFFVFVAEPDPSEAAGVINKVFTIVIDRSGSMYGSKMDQAKSATTYILDNLNEGDMFNVVDYATDVSGFRPAHVAYTASARDSAIEYISGFLGNGLTNISGAFDVAVPQFGVAGDNTANIIIFLTDGEPTWGITSTDDIVAHVAALRTTAETSLSIFTFGVGSTVNMQLLTVLAKENGGIAESLGDADLETVITEFYKTIRNPVLLDTRVDFQPAIVAETFPDPLPNLYKGQQMVVAGRYGTAMPVTVNLTGSLYGKDVAYQYVLSLSDSAATKYQFLPKLWAKQKIEHLMIEYNVVNPSSSDAEILKQQIVDLSVAYGVISEFTSYTDPGHSTGVEEMADDELAELRPEAKRYELLGNSPNPFNPVTTIRFAVNFDLHHVVKVRVYNLAGQLVAILGVSVHGPGTYSVLWNARTVNGRAAASGVYIYVVDFGDALMGGRMHLVR
jgi:Ca-activated chloride channel homolog